MGRAPCCDKAKVKKGPWSPEEDAKLKEYIEKYGFEGNWIALPQKAGLRRCGKSCRLRWLNYLRPNIKHGEFSDEEDRIICSLYASIGSRWSIIAAQLQGRTDNDIKNYWNTKLKKKLMETMISSSQKRPNQAMTNPSFSLLHNSSVVSSSVYSCPSAALSSAVSTYNSCLSNNYCATTSSSFTGYETMATPPSLLTMATTSSSNASSAPTVLQAQDGFVGPMHNYQQKGETILSGRVEINQPCERLINQSRLTQEFSEKKDGAFTFGAEASCSSSDGSSINQINHGREVEYDHGVSNGEKFEFHGHLCNGYANERPNGCYGENSLDDSLEEIKQLISTNSCNNLNFFFDEKKG